MTDAAALARLHRDAFVTGRPWSAAAFSSLLSDPLVHLYGGADGFALTRTVAGETELLTLAVAPSHRRKGIATTLLKAWLDDARMHAETAFLEVAADNAPAQGLYARIGFAETARRRGYYARADGPAVDAVMMHLALTAR